MKLKHRSLLLLCAPLLLLSTQASAANEAAKVTMLAGTSIPDLNGTWTGASAPPVVAPNANVCLMGCGPRGGGRGGGAGGAGAAGAAGREGGGAGAAGAAGREGGGALAAGGRGAPNFPKYKPEFQAKVKQLSEAQVKTDGVLSCQIPGVPRIGPPDKIIQTAREVVFLYDDVNGSFFRIIPTDGRGFRTNYYPTFLGDSIGRYEGDTLVVETQNLSDETWLIDNGAFHTTGLKVVERLRRTPTNIEYSVTSHDPAVLAEPWAGRTRTLNLATSEIEESARCEDRTMDNVVDGTHHDNPR